MPALVVSNAALVTLRWSNGPVTMFNVIGALVAAPTTINQALANTLDAAIKAAFVAQLKARINASAALLSVGIRDLRNPNLAEFIGSGGLEVGGNVGDGLPKQTAYVVSLRTAKAGQSFRGRIYLGGFSETDSNVTGDALTVVGTSAVAFINAISTAFSANGLTLAVVSRPSERKTIVTTVFHGDGSTDVDTKTIAARSGTVTAVTSIVARNAVWDTQRRRSAAGSGSTLFGPPVARVELSPEGSA